MKAVNDYAGIRELLADNHLVWLPHVDNDPFDTIPVLEFLEIVGQVRLGARRQHLEHGSHFQVDQDASWLIQNMQLIHA